MHFANKLNLVSICTYFGEFFPIIKFPIRSRSLRGPNSEIIEATEKMQTKNPKQKIRSQLS